MAKHEVTVYRQALIFSDAEIFCYICTANKKKKCSAAFILLFPFKLKGFILCKVFHNVVEHISVKAGLTQSSSLHEQSSQLFNTEDSYCV